MAPAGVTTRRKGSLQAAQLASPKSSIATAPSPRKRKLQPKLKGRVETFLTNASPKTMPISPANPTKKRKTCAPDAAAAKPVIRPTSNTSHVKATIKGKTAKTETDEPAEKRLRVFRKQAPQTYLQKLGRAQNQRMVVLNRRRVGNESLPGEEVDLVGSTGNVYKVTLGLEPRCSCPDFLKGNQCKHIVYVLVNVLKAPPHLQYQLAFLSSELREILALAPPIPTEIDSADEKSGNRRPVEGECPICYMDFDEKHNKIVWCKAACGNNMHKSCFDQWVASQRGSIVRCVYCRTPWENDSGDLSKAADSGIVGEDGYVNVAHLTGQSTNRDVSTYNPYWVRRTYYGMGY